MFVAMEMSVVVVEKLGRSAGDQRRHYEMAAGSASEVTMALRIAVAKRYVSKEDLAEVEGPLDQVRAMLVRLTHR
jgi:four helix bundle protein